MSAEPYLPARSRGRTVDVPTVARIVFGLPWFAYSVAVVGLIAYPVGGFTASALVAAGWVASGGLIFYSRVERLIASRLFGARPPSPREWAVLAPLWRDVASRADIDPASYQLWVEDSDQINASAAAGHIVTVTRYALTQLPQPHLAAVLAHELGHHRGGHAWSSLLMYWYSLPARLFTRAMVAIARVAVWIVGSVIAYIAELPFLLMLAGLFVLGSLLVSGVGVAGVYAYDLIRAGQFYLLALLALAIFSPLLSPWFARRAELRADVAAADLGYGSALLEYFDDEQRTGMPVRSEIPIRAQLFGTHPPIDVRRRALHAHLRRTRRLA